MKFFIVLPTFLLLFSLALNCNDKKATVPWQLLDPGSIGPANFVDTAFLLLDDCIVENYTRSIEEIIAWGATKFGVGGFAHGGSPMIWYASPSCLCGRYSTIDSNGVLVSGGITDRTGCEDSKDYEPDGSHLPKGFSVGDTLYLKDYLLENWPEGRPALEHSIYTRVTTAGDTSRYAIPKLCGQFLLIDQNGLPTGRHYVGVGGCADYREMINQ